MSWRGATVCDPATPLDSAIPFLPWTIVIYHSLFYLFYPLPLLSMPEGRRARLEALVLSQVPLRSFHLPPNFNQNNARSGLARDHLDFQLLLRGVPGASAFALAGTGERGRHVSHLPVHVQGTLARGLSIQLMAKEVFS